MSCDIPIELGEKESIVRAIYSPYHYKAGKLHRNAFKPPAGTDELSVIRGDYVLAAATGELVASHDPSRVYVGRARSTVNSIRGVGAEVVDAREDFCGHAHVHQGFVVPKGAADHRDDPEVAMLLSRQIDRLNAMLAVFVFEPSA